MKVAIVALALSACVTTTQPAQLVTLGPSPAPPWSGLRDALADCTSLHAISGQVLVRIEIDDDGGAGTISANRDGNELASCIGKEIGAMRFPRAQRGRAIEVPFTASATASAQ